MRTLMNVPVILLLTACLLSGSGCGGSGDDKIVSVSGTVTYQGNPVPGIVVSFVPQMVTYSGPSTGKTDENGRYELTVFKTGRSGAVACTHKVWLSLPREEPTKVDKDEKMMKKKAEKSKKKGGSATEMLPADIAKILKKYGNLEKTPLTFEVTGEPIDLNLN